MSDRFGGADVIVSLGPCACPSTPHAGGDEAYLLPRLTFAGGAAAEAVFMEHGGLPTFPVALSEAYIRHQVAGWNLTGDDGAPIPWSTDLLLADWGLARAVANRADDLYSAAVLAPLVAAVSTSSPDGRTAPSTSPRTPRASRPRKR